MTSGGQGTLARLGRGWSYLYEGTLLDRLKWRWRERHRARRRAAWAALAKRAASLEAEVEPGVRMRLYCDDELSRLIYCDDFEWQERRFLAAFLRPDDIFVDVGANIGLFTVIAAHRVGPGGHVFAFEPSPRAFERLRENVGLNGTGNVSCFPLALSDRSGTTTLQVSLQGYDAWNSLARPIAGEAFAAQRVPCASWDEFAREHRLIGRVAMMKIDVEGWESRVLEGGRQSLRQPDAPVLQVEFTDAVSQAAGSSCARVYRMLEELGYQMFVFNGFSGRLVSDPLREEYPYVNLIAAKRLGDVTARLARRRFPGRDGPPC